MPIWGRELLIVAAVGIVAALIHSIIHRTVSPASLIKHNDVAGFVFSVIGVIYAVVLGFVVVIVWEKFDATNDHVQIEAAAASDLYRTVGALDPAFGVKIRRQLVDLRASRDRYRVAADGAERASACGDGVRPRRPGRRNQPLSAEGAGRKSTFTRCALGDAERLLDARRQRIADTTPSVPELLWFALICGAAADAWFLVPVRRRKPARSTRS